MFLWHKNPGTTNLVHLGEEYLVDAETGAFDLPEHVANELKEFPHWLKTASVEHIAAIKKALSAATGDVEAEVKKVTKTATAATGTVRKGKAAAEADAATLEAEAKAAEAAAAAEAEAAAAAAKAAPKS